MDWSGVVGVLQDLKAPKGYSITQLLRSSVPALVQALPVWYPDLQVGGERCHLDLNFYYDRCALAAEPFDRPIMPIVAMHDEALVGLITFERDADARSVSCRVGVIAPEHRGPTLALLGPMLLEKIGRATGAELVLYYATLKSPHQQVLAERCRYTLAGIVPACDLGIIGNGEVKRVYEALYAKVLVDRDRVVEPGDSALTVRTRAVWQALFLR